VTLPQWRTFPDVDTLVTQLADAGCTEANQAIAARGAFHLVLAGGSTPQALYRALAGRTAGNANWHIWYGDERCLPLDHPERNSRMIEAVWLKASRIPPKNRQPIPAELGSALAASRYGAQLGQVAEFDLVLLGMGEDGHTASLFPGHDWGLQFDSPGVLAVHAAPKPPPERVSLSAARLNRSQSVWIIVTGAAKTAAIAEWKAGRKLPVAAIHGKNETVVWVDAAALPTED